MHQNAKRRKVPLEEIDVERIVGAVAKMPHSKIWGSSEEEVAKKLSRVIGIREEDGGATEEELHEAIVTILRNAVRQKRLNVKKVGEKFTYTIPRRRQHHRRRNRGENHMRRFDQWSGPLPGTP